MQHSIAGDFRWRGELHPKPVSLQSNSSCKKPPPHEIFTRFQHTWTFPWSGMWISSVLSRIDWWEGSPHTGNCWQPPAALQKEVSTSATEVPLHQTLPVLSSYSAVTGICYSVCVLKDARRYLTKQMYDLFHTWFQSKRVWPDSLHRNHNTLKNTSSSSENLSPCVLIHTVGFFHTIL